MRDTKVLIESGKKKVKIVDEGYGIDFCTMRNGFQWSGFGVDNELLAMMREAIDKYLGVWTSVDERLPEIPNGNHAVEVDVVVFDSVYEEIHPGGGQSVCDMIFNKKGEFQECCCSPNGISWITPSDPVTHWRYKPLPPKLEKRLKS